MDGASSPGAMGEVPPEVDGQTSQNPPGIPKTGRRLRVTRASTVA